MSLHDQHLKIKKSARTEATYETDKLQLDTSSTGLHLVTCKIPKPGSSTMLKLSTPEVLDLLDLLLEARRDGMLGKVVVYRQATLEETRQADLEVTR